VFEVLGGQGVEPGPYRGVQLFERAEAVESKVGLRAGKVLRGDRAPEIDVEAGFTRRDMKGHERRFVVSLVHEIPEVDDYSVAGGFEKVDGARKLRSAFGITNGEFHSVEEEAESGREKLARVQCGLGRKRFEGFKRTAQIFEFGSLIEDLGDTGRRGGHD
jgi:hypothetical protein